MAVLQVSTELIPVNGLQRLTTARTALTCLLLVGYDIEVVAVGARLYCHFSPAPSLCPESTSAC
jgi:hypothetical protein